jgi:hypothetical protein
MRPAIFQIPGAGVIPCGLPPLWNQERKKTNSKSVEEHARVSAALPQCLLQEGFVWGPVAKRLHASQSNKNGKKNKTTVAKITSQSPSSV